jgi:hypothetical protein
MLKSHSLHVRQEASLVYGRSAVVDRPSESVCSVDAVQVSDLKFRVECFNVEVSFAADLDVTT